jgi:hypothetical protein
VRHQQRIAALHLTQQKPRFQPPQVNFDETSKQLIKETRHRLPAQPGKPQRFDYE